MTYREEHCPKRKLVRKSMGWVFALALNVPVYALIAGQYALAAQGPLQSARKTPEQARR